MRVAVAPVTASSPPFLEMVSAFFDRLSADPGRGGGISSALVADGDPLGRAEGSAEAGFAAELGGGWLLVE